MPRLRHYCKHPSGDSGRQRRGTHKVNPRADDTRSRAHRRLIYGPEQDT